MKAATADRQTVEELRGITKDWHGFLAKSPEAGQQALRKLLAGPIVVTWQPDGGWSIRGQGRLGRVFEFAHVLVPATEFDHWNEAADAGALDGEEYSAVYPLRGTR